MTEIPADLLAEAVGRLLKVDLWGCRIEAAQCRALFEKSLSYGKLKFMNLGGYNLGKRFCTGESYLSEELDEELVTKVRKQTMIVYFPTGLHPRLW